jgi:capsid protein
MARKKTPLLSTAQLLEQRPTLYDHTGKQISANIYQDVDQTYLNRRRSTYWNNFGQSYGQLVPAWARKQALSSARDYYNNDGIVRGVVNNIAVTSIQNGYYPQWAGSPENEQWAKQAAKTWERWSGIADYRGVTDFFGLLRMSVISALVDGDCLWVKTMRADGKTPCHQVIESHNIANPDGLPEDGILQDGPYKNYKMVQGCVINKTGMTVAYHIKGQASDGSDDSYVNRKNAYLFYIPYMFSQFRGVSALAPVLGIFRDHKWTQDTYQQLLKQDATLNVNIKSERSVSDFADKLGEETNDAGETQPVFGKYVDGPEVRIFKTDEGQELVTSHRPAAEVMEFMNSMLKNALEGMGWKYELYDTTKLSGASARYVLAEAQRLIAYTYQSALYGLWNDMFSYEMATLMTNGQIPYNKEWYMFTPSGTRRLVLDYFKDDKANDLQINNGTKSRTMVCSEEGNSFDEVLTQKNNEWKKAKALQDAGGAPVAWLLQNTPNPTPEPAPEPTTDKE